MFKYSNAEPPTIFYEKQYDYHEVALYCQSIQPGLLYAASIVYDIMYVYSRICQCKL